MNKNLAYALGVIVALAGLSGILYITLERPDASATFTSTVVMLFGLIATFFVTVNGNSKVQERLEKVESNTNGRLHAKDELLLELQRKMLAAGLDPQTGDPITDTTDIQT